MSFSLYLYIVLSTYKARPCWLVDHHIIYPGISPDGVPLVCMATIGFRLGILSGSFSKLNHVLLSD